MELHICMIQQSYGHESQIGPWLATLQPGQLVSFREPNGAVMTDMKPPQEGRNTGAPSLRGLQSSSATGLNGQAAKEEVSAPWQEGLDAGKYLWRSGREKCFSLDIPFYRTFPQPRRRRVFGYTPNVSTVQPRVTFLNGLARSARFVSVLERPHWQAAQGGGDSLLPARHQKDEELF